MLCLDPEEADALRWTLEWSEQEGQELQAAQPPLSSEQLEALCPGAAIVESHSHSEEKEEAFDPPPQPSLRILAILRDTVCGWPSPLAMKLGTCCWEKMSSMIAEFRACERSLGLG